MLRSIFLCLASSACLNLASSPFDQGYLAFLAFLPLLTFRGRTGRQRFLWGWFAGFLTQVLAYGWIFYTVRDFGGLNAGLSLLGASLFWLYQGLDLAFWLWLCPIFGRDRFAPLSAAATWYLLQAHVFPYIFPWVFGASFVAPEWLGGGAVFWSDHGLGFLAVLFQALLMDGFPQRPDRTRLALAAGTLLLFFPGSLVDQRPPSNEWKVAVIQPNLIPWAKRDHLHAADIFEAHYRPSLEAAELKPDLIIWPETAVPFPLNQSTGHQRRLRELAALSGGAVVVGAIERDDDKGQLFNSIFMFTPDGAPPSIYRKERLVLFSEQMPWILSWSKRFVAGLGGFSPGLENRPFQFKGKKLVPLVCYEALFSDYVFNYRGNLLLNVTNDAWFGETRASTLHLQQIRTRCRENRVPMVRATNSGISAWIDVDGSVHGATGIYQQAYPIYKIPVPDEIPTRYAHLGASLIHYLSLGILLAGLIHGIMLRRRTQARTDVNR